MYIYRNTDVATIENSLVGFDNTVFRFLTEMGSTYSFIPLFTRAGYIANKNLIYYNHRSKCLSNSEGNQMASCRSIVSVQLEVDIGILRLFTTITGVNPLDELINKIDNL